MSKANKEIQVLSDFEHILKRPTIYVGSVKLSEEFVPIVENSSSVKSHSKMISVGMYKLFDEVFSNSVDEAKRMKTKMPFIKVDVNTEENSISITDSGEGFINGSVINKKSGLSNVATAVSMLRAGSNFDNDSIEESLIGTNGMGVSLVNALSSFFEIETVNPDESYLQRWDNFKMSDAIIAKKKRSQPTGTRVSFKPLDQVFESCKWDYDILKSILVLKKRVLETEEKTDSIDIQFVWNGKLESVNSSLKPDYSFKTPIGEFLLWKKTDLTNSFSFVNSALCTGIHQKIVLDKINQELEDSLGHHFYDTLIILNLPPGKVRFGDQNKTKFVSKREDVENIILKHFDSGLNKLFKSEAFQAITKLVNERKRETEIKKIRKEKKNVKVKFSHKYFPPTAPKAENLFIVEGLCIDENEKINIWREGELINLAIKDVKIGDEVITHQNRIRTIVNKQRKLKECVTIKLSDGTTIKQPKSHQYYTFNKSSLTFSFKRVDQIDISQDSLVKSNLGEFIGNLEVIDYLRIDDEKYPNQLFLEDGSLYQFSDSHKYCVYNKEESSFVMKLGKDVRKGEFICVFDFV